MALITRIDPGTYEIQIGSTSFVAYRNEAGFRGREWSLRSATDRELVGDLPTRKACIAEAERIVDERHAAEKAIAGLDCGADYCVDPGNCAKHDAPVDPEALVIAEIALFERGDRIEITSKLGTVFTATFVRRTIGADEADRRTLWIAEPSIALSRDGDGAGTYPIRYSQIRSIRELPAVAPDVDREGRIRARGLAREAEMLLSNVAATRDEVLRAGRLLHEAANAAHWAAVPLRDALGAALDRNDAQRGSTSRMEVPAGAGESYADHAAEPKTDARRARVACAVGRSASFPTGASRSTPLDT